MVSKQVFSAWLFLNLFFLSLVSMKWLWPIGTGNWKLCLLLFLLFFWSPFLRQWVWLIGIGSWRPCPLFFLLFWPARYSWLFPCRVRLSFFRLLSFYSLWPRPVVRLLALEPRVPHTLLQFSPLAVFACRCIWIYRLLASHPSLVKKSSAHNKPLSESTQKLSIA